VATWSGSFAIYEVVKEMTMANLLVILIVIVACAYTIKSLYKRLKTQQGCHCGCSVCTVETTFCKQSEISANEV
jgi:hypothetical protein